VTFPPVVLRLPDWVGEMTSGGVFQTLEDQMAFVVSLARRNVAEGTGGPFASAVFEIESGRLVAPGVNLVVPSSAAIAHAEVTAIAVAGQVCGGFDLGGSDRPPMALVASTEPCAMCFGAVPWSGVRRLVCGARDEDARAIGFDEGPKLLDWPQALAERGIEVVRDVMRAEARRVLEDYAAAGGVIYNGRLGD